MSGALLPVFYLFLLGKKLKDRSNIDKTWSLLTSLRSQEKSITYLALDVSPAELNTSVRKLARAFPSGGRIRAYGLLGTYDDGAMWLQNLPEDDPFPLTIIWLGNSIGNFSSTAATAMLERFRLCCTHRDLQYLVGVDGCRNEDMMRRAYDPSNEATRRFLLNGLAHADKVISTACFARFDWQCVGLYDPTESGWKQYYVAAKAGTICIEGRRFRFEEGERVLAIRSAKWGEQNMRDISRAASLRIKSIWRSSDDDYGLTHCSSAGYSVH